MHTSNSLFKTELNKKLNEAIFGDQNGMLPILQPQIIDHVITPEPVVTNSETTALGEPRSDLESQKQGGEINPEVLSEVLSLLISIGFIFSKEGILPDKYNIPGILDLLNTHYNKSDITTIVPDGEQIDQATVEIQPQQGIINAMLESRKMLDKLI